MASASFVEVVSHFAGYLQIFYDIARDRIAYDETLTPGPQADYTTPRSNNEHPFDPDDLDTKAGPAPELMPDEPVHFAHAHPIRAIHDAPDLDLDPFAPSLGPNIKLPMPVGGGGGGAEFHIKVVYQPGGEQTELQVHQYNVLHDDDTLLPSDFTLPCDSLALNLTSDIFATVKSLVDAANSQIPSEWSMPTNGTAATDFLISHDANWAANDGAPDANSVQPGYYLNGVLQDPPPTPPDQTPIGEPKPLPELGEGPGQLAVLGSNSSLNAALIVDLGESGRTMVVKGDYFSTNAIFQTNTIVDQDQISVSGGTAMPKVIGDNVTDNIADFVQKDGVYASLPATFAGPNWSVDVVEGNFYSVNTVVQTNYLFDNDVVVQVSADTKYSIVDGYNQQGNLGQIFDGSIKYDLIVIEGAYQGVNVIFQNNVLLNNDQINMAAANGTDPEQSVKSGANDLTNLATIESYGGDKFGEMTGGIESILVALESGATSLDPSLGTAVAGTGGVFKVLYVKGDYYDVNAVWQTNVTSDVNVMYQLQNPPSADLLANFPGATQTQSVITGDNSLLNDAAIVDVGPTNTYVGGHVYTDSIMVQANLLPTDQDKAVNADTNALVTELVAFVNDAPNETCPPPAAIPASVHADPMASMLH